MIVEFIIIFGFLCTFVVGASSINEMRIQDIDIDIYGINIPISSIKMKIVYVIILFLILGAVCISLLLKVIKGESRTEPRKEPRKEPDRITDD